MIRRATDLLGQPLLNELRRMRGEFCRIVKRDPPAYEITDINQSSLILPAMRVPEDYAAMQALAAWIHNGPKIVHVSREQQDALREVAVNLELVDIEQPYPTVLVELDIPPFTSCLCYRYEPDIMILSLQSTDGRKDLVTMMRHQPGLLVERSLEKVKEADLEQTLPQSLATQRVAINMMLALVHYGYCTEPALAAEFARDQRLADEPTERGRKARERVALAGHVISFSQDVILHETHQHTAGEPTGVEVGSHWRRGHWSRQTHGPRNSLRKRIFRKPVLVRADKFFGEAADTTTTYRT